MAAPKTKHGFFRNAYEAIVAARTAQAARYVKRFDEHFDGKTGRGGYHPF